MDQIVQYVIYFWHITSIDKNWIQALFADLVSYLGL